MKLDRINVSLNLAEIKSLCRLLGNLTDVEFEKCGIVGEGRELLREIYIEFGYFDNLNEDD